MTFGVMARARVRARVRVLGEGAGEGAVCEIGGGVWRFNAMSATVIPKADLETLTSLGFTTTRRAPAPPKSPLKYAARTSTALLGDATGPETCPDTAHRRPLEENEMAPITPEIKVKNPRGAVTTDPAQTHVTQYFR
jgi:hypothetical protein